MSKCSITHLESAMTSITEGLRDVEELLDKIKPRFEQFKPLFDPQRIGFCLDKYISAELDFNTAGVRGVGRMTDFVPRFGGYFRKSLSSMAQMDLSRLYGIIQDVILRGYLVHVLLIRKSVGDVAISRPEDLYEKWIPGIYAGDPSEMGANLASVLEMCTDSASKELQSFMNSHGMKGGGLLSKDKSQFIVSWYPFVGFALSVVESTGG